jgi:hypothetical protein
MMTHQKSLMNQQVRRKKRIYGSIVTRLTRGKPPLGLARLKDADAAETVHHTVYNIYLSYPISIINDNMTQQPRFSLGKRMGHCASPAMPNKTKPKPKTNKKPL